MSRTESNPDNYLTIKALAWYLFRGHVLEVSEPEPRGKRPPSNEPPREISIVVRNPGALDSIRWEIMKREVGRHSGARGPGDQATREGA